MEHSGSDRPGPVPPAAAGLLLGILMVDLLLRLAPALPAEDEAAADGQPWLTTPGRLASVEGIGRVRAMVIARALWEDGPGVDLEGLPGVGAATAAAVRGLIRHAADESVHFSDGSLDRPHP